MSRFPNRLPVALALGFLAPATLMSPPPAPPAATPRPPVPAGTAGGPASPPAPPRPSRSATRASASATLLRGGAIVPRSDSAPAFTFTLVDAGAIHSSGFIPSSTIIFLDYQVGTFVATLDVPVGVDANGEFISKRRVNWCLFHDYWHQSLTVTLHNYRGYHSHPIDLEGYST